MRTSRLAPAATAAAALLALAPVGAAAHKHSSPSGRCRININTPVQIAAGESVVAFGRLMCVRPASAAGQTVNLFEHSFGVPGFTQVQSATTDGHGFYELTEPNVQATSSFFVRSHGAQSGRRRVRVEANVTLSGPPAGSQLMTGAPNKVTFTGAVNPADVGAQVILQRQSSLTGNEWHWIGRGVVVPGASATEGRFTIEHTFIVPGDANIRVLVRLPRRNVASFSNEIPYEISQSQNPQLTIEAAPNPIADGQSTVISGVAAGVDDQPVTLLARTALQHGFAAVAETTTDATGKYSFPAQSPINSTFYRVQTGGKSAGAQKSAVLFEGVKDVLTASVSATTVQAGQSLTFSGTVAPDHTGHIIYLERHNAWGSGFHVSQVVTIGAGSSYTIVHKVYDPGTKVFRVRIPGGPDNEGAVSAPFTITVTPAPATALKPEPQSNSSQPAEGTASGGKPNGGENNEGEGEGKGGQGGRGH